MKLNRILITIVMFVFFVTPAFASYVDNFSKDVKIQSALTLLEHNGAKEVFDNLELNAVKISFYDLSQISYNYVSHFAINTIDSFGNRHILINTRYKNASVEEIACLIAHESCHVMAVATVEEETVATRTEAYYWGLLRDKNKTYTQSALLERLNGLVALNEASTDDKDLIEEKITNSSFYIEQLAIVQ
ncbi:MAG: hypothetical protein NC200_05460 [Candidatus Gastranaerophilales bacterium]|nr:hypothetical protein [Candidatus Gastranaerophilales bacterium]